MNVEVNRVRTYRRWDDSQWVGEDGLELAKAGFYATENYLNVKCHFCGLIIFVGSSVSSIGTRHRELSPNCSFLLHPDRTDNVRCFDAAELKREDCRLATYVNWPVSHISPNSLAKAGFYYTHISNDLIRESRELNRGAYGVLTGCMPMLGSKVGFELMLFAITFAHSGKNF